jgi:phage host-nuclease inhibitor protein Gam
MNKSLSISITLLLTVVVMSMIGIYPLKQMVYAHTFSGDESAAFLALVRQIEAEIGLVNTNLSSNITLAQEHAEHATEHLDTNTTKELAERNKRVANDLTTELADLQNAIRATPAPTVQEIRNNISNINDTLQEAVSVRIEKDQLNNSTVNALAINDILGEVLESYGAAYGIEEEGEQGKEYGNMTETETNTTGTEASTNTTTIIDQAEYQSAQAYANEAKQMLDEIKVLASSNATSAIANVKSGLNEMITAINNKAPFNSVDEIVDSKVLPSLNFNLTQLSLE